jgi:hypothetical protein
MSTSYCDSKRPDAIRWFLTSQQGHDDQAAAWFLFSVKWRFLLQATGNHYQQSEKNEVTDRLSDFAILVPIALLSVSLPVPPHGHQVNTAD